MNAGSNATFQTSDYLPSWTPFVTSINMNGTGGTNDCISYINKLTNIGAIYSPGKLIISAAARGYGNTKWYFDDTNPQEYTNLLYPAVVAITNINTNALVTYIDVTSGIASGTLAGHITNAASVAGFGSWGAHGYWGGYYGTNYIATGTNWGYATNGTIIFTGNSGWYIMETYESFNGQQVPEILQGNYLSWYASNAFGGTNYSNTPVGAVCNVDEPETSGVNYPAVYFGDWAVGRIFAYCSWNSFPKLTHYLQVVGDPFVQQ